MAQMQNKPSTSSVSGKGEEYTYEITHEDASTIIVAVKVSAARLSTGRDKAYTKLAPDVKVQGFRPGKAPKEVIEAKLGATLYEEAVNAMLPVITSEIINNHDYEPLDYAKYQVTKLSDTDGVEFNATFTIVPQIDLPDFKKLKVEQDKVEVKKEEVDKLFEQMVNDVQSKKDPEGEDKTVEKKDKAEKKDKVEKKDKKSEKSEKIDWAKELGRDDIKTDADLKKVLEENLLKQKEHDAEDQYLTKLVQEAVKATKIEAPKPVLEAQAKAKEEDYTKRIKELGLEVQDFLKTQGADLEQMRQNWKEEAKFQISSDLLFIAISKQHKIQVKPEDIDAELAKITDPKLKEQYEQPAGRNSIASVLLRQKTVDWLRNQVK